MPATLTAAACEPGKNYTTTRGAPIECLGPKDGTDMILFRSLETGREVPFPPSYPVMEQPITRPPPSDGIAALVGAHHAHVRERIPTLTEEQLHELSGADDRMFLQHAIGEELIRRQHGRPSEPPASAEASASESPELSRTILEAAGMVVRDPPTDLPSPPTTNDEPAVAVADEPAVRAPRRKRAPRTVIAAEVSSGGERVAGPPSATAAPEPATSAPDPFVASIGSMHRWVDEPADPGEPVPRVSHALDVLEASARAAMAELGVVMARLKAMGLKVTVTLETK